MTEGDQRFQGGPAESPRCPKQPVVESAGIAFSTSSPFFDSRRQWPAPHRTLPFTVSLTCAD